MSRVTLISERYYREHSDVSDSIQSKSVIVAIEEAQDFYLSAVIGDKFLNLLLYEVEYDVLRERTKFFLDTYVLPYLVYQVSAILAAKLNYKIGNAGVVSNEKATDPKKIVDYYNQQVGIALKRLTLFLSRHYGDYADLLDGVEGIKPHLSASDSTNIYLGGITKIKGPVDPGWRR